MVGDRKIMIQPSEYRGGVPSLLVMHTNTSTSFKYSWTLTP